MKKYHVIVINRKTQSKSYMTKTPVNHQQACTILSKLTKHSFRLETLEEVAQ